MASSSKAVKPRVGILSVGDMGMGIAKLLIAHDYSVRTVSAGRSKHTIERIRSASITDLPSDEALVAEADIIFSIVPPRDAVATARRVFDACKVSGSALQGKNAAIKEILYVDLNAISPRTTKKIARIFSPGAVSPEPQESIVRKLSRSLSSASARDSDGPPAVFVRYMDGGIIGGPPTEQADGSWKRPSIPIAGPEELPEEMMSLMNMKVVSQEIGPASALKACFASLTKGFTALSILSFTTAQTAGVLPDLQEHLDEFAPGLRQRAEKGIVGMCPKAYRWVDEMHQIGETFSLQGGFTRGLGGQEIYDNIGDVYQFVADETVLGQERIGKRKRGTTAEDVSTAIREGMHARKRKASNGGDKEDEKLELAWRGSWT